MPTAKMIKRSGSGAAGVEPQVVGGARDYVFRIKQPRQSPCKICGSPGATKRSDGLCWVCQHLKISAWRESSAQDSPGD